MPKSTPCALHAWQPVALPDGRTAILCGKCGQHAVTLAPDQTPGFLPPVPAPQPYPWYRPIWVDPQFLRPYPPAPTIYPTAPVIPTWPYTITFSAGANGVPSDAIPLT